MATFAWFRERLRRRDARAYALLGELRDHAARLPEGDVVWVQSVYQAARRGTKAVVYSERSGRERDAWFWWSRVTVGEVMAVQASSGYGPHTPRDDVLYVGGERTGSGIHRAMSRREAKRATRHYRLFAG